MVMDLAAYTIENSFGHGSILSVEKSHQCLYPESADLARTMHGQALRAR
jgi:hypothetical protein